MTLPRQDRREKPRNGPPAAALDPAVPNPAALRLDEQTVLGWFLTPANHSEAKQHLDDIDIRHFYLPAHQEIYAAITLHAGAPNIATLVTADLVGPGAPRSIQALPDGLISYLSECKEYGDILGVKELAFHIGRTREAHTRRRRFEIHHRASKALEEDDLAAYDAALGEMATTFAEGTGREEDGRPRYGDIAALLDAGVPEPPRPDLLCREDGVALFYRAKVNVLFGDPECGKTWIALAAIVEVLSIGGKAAFLDLDHNGQEEIVSRLLLLGAHPSQLRDLDRFRYCEPDDGVELEFFARDVAEWQPDLAVVDSLGEVMPMLGLSSNSPDDFTIGNRKVMTRLANSGAAVVAIDHLPKDEGARVHGQTGTVAKKRAANGASLRVVAKEQFTPGYGGSANISIHKDRPGGLRRHCPPGKNAPAGRFVMEQRGLVVEWRVTKPLTNAAATPTGVSTEDVAAVLNLPIELRTKRKVQDHFKWGSDRAHRALQKCRELGEVSDEQ